MTMLGVAYDKKANDTIFFCLNRFCNINTIQTTHHSLLNEYILILHSIWDDFPTEVLETKI